MSDKKVWTPLELIKVPNVLVSDEGTFEMVLNRERLFLSTADGGTGFYVNLEDERVLLAGLLKRQEERRNKPNPELDALLEEMEKEEDRERGWGG